MKKLILLSSIVSVLFSLFWNCESPNNSQENMAVLTGQVFNYDTNDPISNAVVILQEYPDISTQTNTNGLFELEFEVNEAEEVHLVTFKESFVADTLVVLAAPGRTISNLVLRLLPTGSTPLPSGDAASIILNGISPSSIGVKESGAPEVAEVVFQVQDSSGIPIDLEHAVQVNFILGSSPDGGEFISPTSAMTSSNGLAKTSIFSGTVAGVVQIVAEVTNGAGTLRSKPVAIAIHGGLPDDTHFSLAVEKLNFPGYNIFGLKDKITAYVGDKYGNPVKEKTAVYFTTDGGIIEGSNLTDLLGQASVNLISAEPRPNHPQYGPGFAIVTGRTADENQDQIEDDIIVLFSGIPQIDVSPSNIDVPNGGSQSFTFRVSDQNLNPLAGGTTINVTVDAGDIKAVGNINVQIPDTQSRSWTNFAFSLIDAKPDSLNLNQASVKIRTEGPNGGLEYSIFGTAQ
jgi:hypothetical protein